MDAELYFRVSTATPQRISMPLHNNTTTQQHSRQMKTTLKTWATAMLGPSPLSRFVKISLEAGPVDRAVPAAAAPEKGSVFVEKTRLYLDFDGVLHPLGWPVEHFKLLPRLEAILREFPHTSVVVTSSWRQAESLEKLRQYFSPDIRARIVGVTPHDAEGTSRMDQVLMHLKATGWTGPFLALDDDRKAFSENWGHLLLCKSNEGLNDERLGILRTWVAEQRVD